MFVSPSDIGDARYVHKTTKTLTEAGHKTGRRIPKGSIVFVCIGSTIGKVAQVGAECTTNQQINAVVPDSKHDANFLLCVLDKEAAQIRLLAGKQAVPIINKSTFAAISITIPTLPEQRKIADFLTAVDRRIQQLSQKKALLEDYKKGAMQQLFTQALRFKDDNGNDFPEWEEKTLGEIAKLYQPKTITQTDLTNEGYTVYGANGIIGKYHSFNHEKPQVTVTCRGSTCGVIGFTEPNSWITGNAMVVNLDNHPDSTKTFVYHSLCATDLRYLITGSGQPQITGNLKGHVIRLPSPPEQTKIANFLSALDRKIESVSQQITHTQTFKKGLLQQMFV